MSQHQAASSLLLSPVMFDVVSCNRVRSRRPAATSVAAQTRRFGLIEEVGWLMVPSNKTFGSVNEIDAIDAIFT